VNYEYLVVDRQGKDHLEPALCVAATNGAKFSAPSPSVSAAADDPLAFRDGYAVLGGMLKVLRHPAEDEAIHPRVLYTPNI
jgi:hypothetical protein